MYQIPGTSKHKNVLRRIAGRLGLDFVVSGFKFANSQLGKQQNIVALLYTNRYLTSFFFDVQITRWRALLEPQCHRQALSHSWILHR
jgi:hypothetical protein